MGILAQGIGKTIGQPPVQILTDINLDIKDAEFLALTGRSGSGKSTLLYVLSTLDNATTGNFTIDDKNVNDMDVDSVHHFRNTQMGFIFQFHYLLADLTALQNILMPARKLHQETQREPYAKSLLERFDLANKMHRLPRQLSGGEQQRVAIARALIMEPRYLFADEPTGSLDSNNSENVMNIITDINQSLKVTVIMVTHEPDFAARANRQINLKDGRIAVS